MGRVKPKDRQPTIALDPKNEMNQPRKAWSERAGLFLFMRLVFPFFSAPFLFGYRVCRSSRVRNTSLFASLFDYIHAYRTTPCVLHLPMSPFSTLNTTNHPIINPTAPPFYASGIPSGLLYASESVSESQLALAASRQWRRASRFIWRLWPCWCVGREGRGGRSEGQSKDRGTLWTTHQRATDARKASDTSIRKRDAPP